MSIAKSDLKYGSNLGLSIVVILSSSVYINSIDLSSFTAFTISYNAFTDNKSSWSKSPI